MTGAAPGRREGCGWWPRLLVLYVSCWGGKRTLHVAPPQLSDLKSQWREPSGPPVGSLSLGFQSFRRPRGGRAA